MGTTHLTPLLMLLLLVQINLADCAAIRATMCWSINAPLDDEYFTDIIYTSACPDVGSHSPVSFYAYIVHFSWRYAVHTIWSMTYIVLYKIGVIINSRPRLHFSLVHYSSHILYSTPARYPTLKRWFIWPTHCTKLLHNTYQPFEYTRLVRCLHKSYVVISILQTHDNLQFILTMNVVGNPFGGVIAASF